MKQIIKQAQEGALSLKKGTVIKMERAEGDEKRAASPEASDPQQ